MNSYICVHPSGCKPARDVEHLQFPHAPSHSVSLKGKHYSNLCHGRLVFQGLTLMSINYMYVHFGVWLLSLNSVSIIFIHFVASDNGSFISIVVYYLIM